MVIKIIPPHSLKAFRYRVQCLGQSLWNETDPIARANLALQLADAATTLARLETQEAQKCQQVVGPDPFNPSDPHTPEGQSS